MIFGQCEKNGIKRVFVKVDDEITILDKNISSTLTLLNSYDYGLPLSQFIVRLIKKSSKKTTYISFNDFINDNNRLLKPINSPEVWAVGVTYKRQAKEHDTDIELKQGRKEDLYQYVYDNERAEVFFKGFDRSIIGSNQTLMLRPDSNNIMPEGELVLILGKNSLPICYTLGNDLTAWDIESECPLYLNQAKIWTGSGSIGPFLTPSDIINNPYEIDIKCEVVRKNKIIISSKGSTSGLKRSIEELCYYLSFSNQIPPGTALFTGTTCVIDHDFCLGNDDVVNITSEKLGTLTNKIGTHEFPMINFEKRNNI